MCFTAFPLEEQGQDPAKVVGVTTVSSARTELWELPFLNAPELWEGCRRCSCVLSVAGNMQGKFLNLVCLSEKSVNGEHKKKRVLIPVSL